MGPKVLFLAALLLATVVLLIVYECLLVTSQNTLRVAVSFPFPFQHKHTSIQLDITNELEGTVEDNGHVPAVNESAAGNVSDGMLQVRSEHLEEQQVASARVPSISLATLHKNSTTYETSISDNVNGMLPFHTEHLDKQQVPSAKVPSISPATLHENSTTYETSISDNLNGMLPLHTEHLDKQQVPSAKVPSISPVTLHENSTTYETSTNSDTSSEHTLPPTVTRSFSSPLTTVSKGEYLSSTNQLPSTLQSSRPVDIISTKRPSLPKILLYQNASISNVMIQPTVGTTSNQVASTISSHRDIPRTSSPRCKQRYCMEHLLSHEKLVYIRCLRRVPMGKDMDCRCQFVAGMGRRVVALVSLPGSGNTWVRGLLEKATGVCTGSIYCDKTLRAEGFCGEGIRSGSALVVKTHDSILQWKGERPHDSVRRDRPFFDAAIFLIRSPFRAAVAEWNREVSSRFARDQNGSNHVKYVDRPQFFGKNAVWSRIVRSQAVKWQLMINSNVLRQGSHRILSVRYEDLKKNPIAEVRRMLDFLQFPYSVADIEQRLHEGFTLFYRNHTDSFEHFTNEQKELVNTIILGTVQKLQHSKHSALGSKLQEYVLR